MYFTTFLASALLILSVFFRRLTQWEGWFVLWAVSLGLVVAGLCWYLLVEFKTKSPRARNRWMIWVFIYLAFAILFYFL